MLREPIMPNIGVGHMRVELDKKSLFALASDTRLDILRSLQPMRRTVTQLADSLNIDKAAIYRHLKKLEEGGLVKRYEDHGFVYYGLSWKARDILSPNDNTKIIVLISSSWLLTVVVAFLVIASLGASGIISLPGTNFQKTGAPIAWENTTYGQYQDPWNAYGGSNYSGGQQTTYWENTTYGYGSAQSSHLPWPFYAASAAGVIMIAGTLAFIAFRGTVKPKQKAEDGKQETIDESIG